MYVCVCVCVFVNYWLNENLKLQHLHSEPSDCPNHPSMPSLHTNVIKYYCIDNTALPMTFYILTAPVSGCLHHSVASAAFFPIRVAKMRHWIYPPYHYPVAAPCCLSANTWPTVLTQVIKLSWSFALCCCFLDSNQDCDSILFWFISIWPVQNHWHCPG